MDFRPVLVKILLSCWFPGSQAWGGKREHGSPSYEGGANRGCPRNCERRAASVTATGKLGRPDAKLRPASQETCQHRHPTDGRGAPYGADFRSGDSVRRRLRAIIIHHGRLCVLTNRWQELNPVEDSEHPPCSGIGGQQDVEETLGGLFAF